ncbi:hypothetical protein DENSPDRAFT_774884, partial [Dentipellis sp. KUC8613]
MLKASPALRGFSIPGLQKRILVSLFADDTALYLSEHDRYDTVQDILDRWCLASGAKFNINKTEIIPIGSETHRQQVIATRKINANDSTPLAEGIRIAKDRESTRYLGAWIGNLVDNTGQWEITLDKVKQDFDRWEMTHPTLEGKRLIVQMSAGGRTQFATKVQGMPTHIENALQKLIRNFLWGEHRSPPISLDHLYRPRCEGGLSLLDIKTRNEAIHITWLRSYLDLTPQRPKWAFITDILINLVTPNTVNDLATLNTFLQTWSPPLTGKNSKVLSRDILDMLKTARKYNTSFAALKLTRSLQLQMPAWYH